MPLLVIAISWVYGDDIFFNHIGTQDGLSGNIIHSLYRDSRGYLWIGCENGLNRYDGYRIVTFGHDPFDSTTISNNDVTGIIEDHEGILWVASKNGVSQFDYSSETFKHIFDATSEQTFFRGFHLSDQNELYLLTAKGIFLFDRSEQKFSPYFSDSIDEGSTCMMELEDGSLIIGTWGDGIILVHPNRQDHSFHKISLPQNEIEINTIESMSMGEDGILYLATQFGITTCRISMDQGKTHINIAPLLNSSITPGKLSHDAVHAVLAKDDKLWIGTEVGLNIYSIHSGEVVQVLHDEENDKSLSNNLITKIYHGAENEIWIGTYQGGVNHFSKGNHRFIDNFPYINKSSERGVKYVKAIFQQPDGVLWLGTDYGLLQFSADFKYQRSFVNSQEPGSIGEGGINWIFLDSKDQLWVGNWGGGVNLLDKNTGKFTQYSRYLEFNTLDPLYAGDWNVRTMLEDTEGNIWIAYMFGILDKFDPKTSQFQHFNLPTLVGRPNMNIRSMKLDNKGSLWIGATDAGIIQFDTKDNSARVYAPRKGEAGNQVSGPPSIDVYAVNIDEEGFIWLGTGNGISIYNPDSETFTNYSTAHGLPSQTVLSLVFDFNNTPWLSTLKGISKFDREAGIFINYDSQDGVLPNAETGYFSHSGTMIFAGVNGINVFKPDSIWENKFEPPVVFTDLKLFNNSVLNNRSILSAHINEVKEIELKYRQNDITIEFAALSFINPKKNTHKYMLEGYDIDWIFAGHNNEAKYTNLDPGRYSFKVLAANSDGIWSSLERELIISIRPPWWSTFFFRAFLIVIAISIVFAFISIRTYRLRQQRKKLILLVEERTSKIEKQRKELEKQSLELQNTNVLLMEKQEKIQLQKAAIEKQNLKLEEKTTLLEFQKNKILEQKSEVEKMAAKLHESDQMKLKFFTNISHEFRTPLSLIILPLKYILSDAKTTENVELFKNINIIHRNTLRLQRLINQFLDLSKIENGVLSLQLANGEVRKYIEEIVEVYQHIADQRNIDLVFNSDFEGECLFDGDKIEKILYNLLFNAFKYTPDDGKITVTLENCLVPDQTGQNKPGICIVVEDNGKGIDPTQQEKVFERFYQVEGDSGAYSGTGIGLSLTIELVKIYRGRVDLESTPGKGSKFIIMLPNTRESFASGEIKGEVSGQWPLSEIPYDIGFDVEDDAGQMVNKNISGKPTILIIEDNADTRMLLKNELKDSFHTFLAADGGEGLKKAFSQSPDIILSDVMMPSMNGYKLCEQVKNDDRTCHIPIVLLTALAEVSNQIEGIEYGADEYIVKPFDIDLLKLKLLKLVENRNKLKQFFHRHMMYPPLEVEITSADEKLMGKVMHILEEDISNPEFGVDALSKKVGLSRTHLYRKLKEITSQSPVEFIRNTRLQRAATMLKENKLYVSEVAFMCGFNEISYFRKMFKDFYGVSPVEYINNHKSA